LAHSAVVNCGRETVEQATDGGPQRLERAWRFSAQQLLKLGNDLFDRIEVRGV
jgi:hypothetical protein